MEIIEDDPSARWLPSRHRFALSRLIASIIHKHASKRMTVDHLLMPIDRDQSAAETYAVSAWVTIAAVAYIAAVLPLIPLAAILVAVPLAFLVLELPVYFGANSFVHLLLQFCAAAYFATVRGPVHYVAWLSLIIFVLNSVAWLINRALGI